MQLIPLGIQAGASILGSKLMGGTPAASQNALDTAGKAMQSGYNMSNMLGNLAGQSFNPVVDYWSRILSGNRGAAMSALAPDIARMGDQATAEMRAASSLMPRSGGRASLMSTIPYQNMQNVQSLFQTLRPQAAGQLGQLGGTMMSGSINALNASTSAGRSIMDYQLEKAKQDYTQGQGFGGAISSLFAGMKGKSGIPKWLGGLGMGTGGGDV